MKFLFVVNLQKSHAKECAEKAMEVIAKSGGECFIDEAVKSDFSSKKCKFLPISAISLVDMIIVLGGDGTIIKAAKYAAPADIPILGLNIGRLGFLSGAEKGEYDKLSCLIKGDYKKTKRMLVEATAKNKTYLAVNDLVISKSSLDTIIDVNITENGQQVINYRADGVIFSTPVGSTAYALSNGGPIADPDLRFISMSAICPHMLISRTYLFSENADLILNVNEGNRAHMIVDGEEVGVLESGDKINIKKSSYTLSLIYLEDNPFFDVVSKKFYNESLYGGNNEKKR